MNDPTADPNGTLPTTRTGRKVDTFDSWACIGDFPSVYGRRKLVSHPSTATRAGTSPSLCFEAQQAMRVGTSPWRV